MSNDNIKLRNFKPDALVRIPVNINNFFKTWLLFLRPYHELTDRQIDVASGFLKYRWELSKVIKNEKLLDENVMGENIKKKIREDCGITYNNFQVVMSELKKHKMIINNTINPKYIPSLKEDTEGFSFMIYFQIQ
jgi:hypothetical protein